MRWTASRSAARSAGTRRSSTGWPTCGRDRARAIERLVRRLGDGAGAPRAAGRGGGGAHRRYRRVRTGGRGRPAGARGQSATPARRTATSTSGAPGCSLWPSATPISAEAGASSSGPRDGDGLQRHAGRSRVSHRGARVARGRRAGLPAAGGIEPRGDRGRGRDARSCKADAGYGALSLPQAVGGRAASRIQASDLRGRGRSPRRAEGTVRRHRHDHGDADDRSSTAQTEQKRALRASRRSRGDEHLVPAVLRTGRRLGSRGLAHARGARMATTGSSTARRSGTRGPSSRTRHPAGAHRSRRTEASRASRASCCR